MNTHKDDKDSIVIPITIELARKKGMKTIVTLLLISLCSFVQIGKCTPTTLYQSGIAGAILEEIAPGG